MASSHESGDAIRRPSVSPSTTTVMSPANFLIPASNYLSPSPSVLFGMPPAPAPYHLEVPSAAAPLDQQLYDTSAASHCSSDHNIFWPSHYGEVLLASVELCCCYLIVEQFTDDFQSISVRRSCSGHTCVAFHVLL